MKSFDDVTKLGKEGMDAAMESLAASSKGMQTLAAEYADYARKSFEQGSGTVEKLIEARSFDRAYEVQSEFFRSAYEGFVAQASKFGEMYTDVAKQAYKPIETYVSKVTPAL